MRRLKELLCRWWRFRPNVRLSAICVTAWVVWVRHAFPIVLTTQRCGSMPHNSLLRHSINHSPSGVRVSPSGTRLVPDEGMVPSGLVSILWVVDSRGKCSVIVCDTVKVVSYRRPLKRLSGQDRVCFVQDHHHQFRTGFRSPTGVRDHARTYRPGR